MRNLRLVHSSTWFEHSSVERDIPPVDATVRALLHHGRIIAPLSPVVRARAIARARAALATLAESAAPATVCGLRRR